MVCPEGAVWYLGDPRVLCSSLFVVIMTDMVLSLVL